MDKSVEILVTKDGTVLGFELPILLTQEVTGKDMVVVAFVEKLGDMYPYINKDTNEVDGTVVVCGDDIFTSPIDIKQLMYIKFKAMNVEMSEVQYKQY